MQRSCKQDSEKKATEGGERERVRGEGRRSRWLEKKDVGGKTRRGRVQLPKAASSSTTSYDEVSTLKSRTEIVSLF